MDPEERNACASVACLRALSPTGGVYLRVELLCMLHIPLTPLSGYARVVAHSGKPPQCPHTLLLRMRCRRPQVYHAASTELRRALGPKLG